MLNWLPKLHTKISKARLIKNAGEILDKLRARDLNATNLSTYDFSTLYTTLSHNLIKDKRIYIIENPLYRECSP